MDEILVAVIVIIGVSADRLTTAVGLMDSHKAPS
jgi:hypothetical protein